MNLGIPGADAKQIEVLPGWKPGHWHHATRQRAEWTAPTPFCVRMDRAPRVVLSGRFCPSGSARVAQRKGSDSIYTLLLGVKSDPPVRENPCCNWAISGLEVAGGRGRYATDVSPLPEGDIGNN